MSDIAAYRAAIDQLRRAFGYSRVQTPDAVASHLFDFRSAVREGEAEGEYAAQELEDVLCRHLSFQFDKSDAVTFEVTWSHDGAEIVMVTCENGDYAYFYEDGTFEVFVDHPEGEWA